MTARAWPTRRFSRTRRRVPRSRSCAAQEPSTVVTGFEIEQLITDNGGAYLSIAHAVACRSLGIRHLRTRPYRPQTNGKAERFIRTMLGGWAYGAIYRNSHERTQALDGWLWHYNHHRKHSALSHKPPIARLNERTNLLDTYN
jgi:transposase InsO family protein